MTLIRSHYLYFADNTLKGYNVFKITYILEVYAYP